MSQVKRDKSIKGIGGTTLIGVGVGLTVPQTTIMMTVGTILAGIGLGIVIIAIVSDNNI
ncbi:MAG TPA: hypothetical protein VJ945_06700 [Flavobacteriaceae bacterium]|nr:hypothetical protein [Flavobacteriaceae bacterium]